MKNIFKNCLIRLCIVACFSLAVSSHLFAQVQRNTGDLSVGAGVFSIANNNVVYLPNTSNPASSFSIGYSPSKWVTVSGEYGYVDFGSGSGESFSDNLFGGSVRFNLLPSKRVVPYVVGNVGDGIITASGGGSSTSYNGLNIGGGAGASFYINHMFGIRPEYRYQRATYNTGSSFAMHSNQETVSFFWQFGGRS